MKTIQLKRGGLCEAGCHRAGCVLVRTGEGEKLVCAECAEQFTRPFRVGVFEHPGARKIKLIAYTTWYSKTWTGCCEHDVQALSGADAKQRAMVEHREKCMVPDAAMRQAREEGKS